MGSREVIDLTRGGSSGSGSDSDPRGGEEEEEEEEEEEVEEDDDGGDRGGGGGDDDVEEEEEEDDDDEDDDEEDDEEEKEEAAAASDESDESDHSGESGGSRRSSGSFEGARLGGGESPAHAPVSSPDRAAGPSPPTPSPPVTWSLLGCRHAEDHREFLFQCVAFLGHLQQRAGSAGTSASASAPAPRIGDVSSHACCEHAKIVEQALVFASVCGPLDPAQQSVSALVAEVPDLVESADEERVTKVFLPKMLEAVAFARRARIVSHLRCVQTFLDTLLAADLQTCVQCIRAYRRLRARLLKRLRRDAAPLSAGGAPVAYTLGSIDAFERALVERDRARTGALLRAGLPSRRRAHVLYEVLFANEALLLVDESLCRAALFDAVADALTAPLPAGTPSLTETLRDLLNPIVLAEHHASGLLVLLFDPRTSSAAETLIQGLGISIQSAADLLSVLPAVSRAFQEFPEFLQRLFGLARDGAQPSVVRQGALHCTMTVLEKYENLWKERLWKRPLLPIAPEDLWGCLFQAFPEPHTRYLWWLLWSVRAIPARFSAMVASMFDYYLDRASGGAEGARLAALDFVEWAYTPQRRVHPPTMQFAVDRIERWKRLVLLFLKPDAPPALRESAAAVAARVASSDGKVLSAALARLRRQRRLQRADTQQSPPDRLPAKWPAPLLSELFSFTAAGLPDRVHSELLAVPGHLGLDCSALAGAVPLESRAITSAFRCINGYLAGALSERPTLLLLDHGLESVVFLLSSPDSGVRVQASAVVRALGVRVGGSSSSGGDLPSVEAALASLTTAHPLRLARAVQAFLKHWLELPFLEQWHRHLWTFAFPRLGSILAALQRLPADRAVDVSDVRAALRKIAWLVCGEVFRCTTLRHDPLPMPLTSFLLFFAEVFPSLAGELYPTRLIQRYRELLGRGGGGGSGVAAAPPAPPPPAAAAAAAPASPPPAAPLPAAATSHTILEAHDLWFPQMLQELVIPLLTDAAGASAARRQGERRLRRDNDPEVARKCALATATVTVLYECARCSVRLAPRSAQLVSFLRDNEGTRKRVPMALRSDLCRLLTKPSGAATPLVLSTPPPRADELLCLAAATNPPRPQWAPPAPVLPPPHQQEQREQEQTVAPPRLRPQQPLLSTPASGTSGGTGAALAGAGAGAGGAAPRFPPQSSACLPHGAITSASVNHTRTEILHLWGRSATTDAVIEDRAARLRAAEEEKDMNSLDALHKDILSWDVAHLDRLPLDLDRLLRDIPVEFDSHEQYRRVMEPLLLAEFFAQLARDWRELPHGDVRTLGTVEGHEWRDQFCSVEFSLPPSKAGSQLAALLRPEGVLALVRQPDASASAPAASAGAADAPPNGPPSRLVRQVAVGQSRLARIISLDSSSRREKRAPRQQPGRREPVSKRQPRGRLFVVVELFSQEPERVRRFADFSSRTEWTLIPFSTLTTLHRMYQALRRAKKFPLLRSILQPSRAASDRPVPAVGARGSWHSVSPLAPAVHTAAPAAAAAAAGGPFAASSAAPDLSARFAYLARAGLNAPQLAAISACAAAPSGFSLLQGPPGTGKTRTILGLLSVLLLSTRPVAASPLQAADRRARGTTRRILVCAPSNAAVDEIVVRLISGGGGLTDSQGRAYTPAVVRVGDPALVASRARCASLLTLVEKQKSLPSWREKTDKVAACRAQMDEAQRELRALDSQISALRAQIDEAEREPAAGAATGADGAVVADLRARLTPLQLDLHRGRTKLKALLDELQRKNCEFREADRGLAKRILMAADIVCCTLTGSGSPVLLELGAPFETVVVDEATQAVEILALVPLQFGAKRCILVGDPNQLSATILSERVVDFDYDRSLFERLQLARHPVHRLIVQYRMHREIRLFPGEAFYGGSLVDAESIPTHTPFAGHPFFRPFAFFDVRHSTESRGQSGSLSNHTEAIFVSRLWSELARVFPDAALADVAVLTPYRQQSRELLAALRRVGAPATVRVDTVDGFQGCEKDIVMFSCVRARSGGIGFLADVRRMNVALTRARRCLVVVGNTAALKCNVVWEHLLRNAAERGLALDGTLAAKFLYKDADERARLDPAAFVRSVSFSGTGTGVALREAVAQARLSSRQRHPSHHGVAGGGGGGDSRTTGDRSPTPPPAASAHEAGHKVVRVEDYLDPEILLRAEESRRVRAEREQQQQQQQQHNAFPGRCEDAAADSRKRPHESLTGRALDCLTEEHAQEEHRQRGLVPPFVRNHTPNSHPPPPPPQQQQEQQDSEQPQAPSQPPGPAPGQCSPPPPRATAVRHETAYSHIWNRRGRYDRILGAGMSAARGARGARGARPSPGMARVMMAIRKQQRK